MYCFTACVVLNWPIFNINKHSKVLIWPFISLNCKKGIKNINIFFKPSCFFLLFITTQLGLIITIPIFTMSLVVRWSHNALGICHVPLTWASLISLFAGSLIASLLLPITSCVDYLPGRADCLPSPAACQYKVDTVVQIGERHVRHVTPSFYCLFHPSYSVLWICA